MIDDHTVSTGSSKDWGILVKVMHLFAGTVIWEILSTFNYEWSVLNGSRKYLRTIWIHIGCRVAALLSFVCALVLVDSERVAKHCQVAYVIYLALVCLSLSFGTLIMVLRTVAIWRGFKIPVMISYGVWLASVALNIREIVLVRAEYNPEWQGCAPLHTRSFLLNTAGIFVSNSILFIVMLVGLFCARDGRGYGLVQFLWYEGVMCMAVVTIAEVPSLVMLGLGASDLSNIILFPLWQAAVAICTTRMYRRLTDYYQEDRGPVFSATHFTQPMQFHIPESYIEHGQGGLVSALGTSASGTTVVSVCK